VEVYAERVPVADALAVDVGFIAVGAVEVEQRADAAAGERAFADGEALRHGEGLAGIPRHLGQAAGVIGVVAGSVDENADGAHVGVALSALADAVGVGAGAVV